MTQYYIENDNRVILYDNDKKRLQNTLDFMPQYSNLNILNLSDEKVIVDYKIMTKEQAEREQAEKERERIAMLSLTAADVERAIYKAKGLDFDDIINFVEQSGAQIDLKALKIELRANNFYRGNPYIEQVGQLLGFTSEQLDEFFETNDYTKLLPSAVEKPVEEPNTSTPNESEVTNDTTVE